MSKEHGLYRNPPQRLWTIVWSIASYDAGKENLVSNGVESRSFGSLDELVKWLSEPGDGEIETLRKNLYESIQDSEAQTLPGLFAVVTGGEINITDYKKLADRVKFMTAGKE